MNNLIYTLKHDLEKIKININSWSINIKKKNKLRNYSRNLYNIYDLLESKYSYLSMPGQYPFIRGVYSSMYIDKLWTIRQYSGFGTAEETNEFYIDCLKNGQKGLSIAFDLPTHRGIDSDSQSAIGDVGKTGVAIDSVEDMKILLYSIPLDSVSVSMTMNGAVLPILASYIVASKEMGFKESALTGTIQNDILKEFIVRNTYIYPPNESMKIIGDIINYLSIYIPKFHPISVSGYHFQEAGAPPELELGLTLANAMEYVKLAVKENIDIDRFTSRLSFFFAIGMDFFTEIAKLRAARWLWATLLNSFNAKIKCKTLKMHCQTSGWSLSAINPLNNIVRTTIEAMAAVLGGTQSLHTNSFDEALALPSHEAAKIARNTQIILQKETGISNVIDPVGGSYYIEALTQRIYKSALFFINKINKNGGVISGIKAGLQKKWILKQAIKTQALIDSEEISIVGVQDDEKSLNNNYRIKHIESNDVFLAQKKKIGIIKKERNNGKVKNILNYLKNTAYDKVNLLDTCIEATKLRSTVGEISDSLALAFGKYSKNNFSINNIYQYNFAKKQDFKNVSRKISKLSLVLGKPPRILMTKIGQDGHDRGLICIASALADLGFDVDILPLFPKVQEIARCAIDNDVNIIGISSMTGGHMELIPMLFKELIGTDIKIIVGGIIQEKEMDKLYNMGVRAIFSPGSKILDIANNIIKHVFNTNDIFSKHK